MHIVNALDGKLEDEISKTCHQWVLNGWTLVLGRNCDD